jgi:hypothetical protein
MFSLYSNGVENVRINGDNGSASWLNGGGNVGIGTTAPSGPLHVSGSIAYVGGPSSGVGYLGLNQGSVANSGYISFHNSSTTRVGYMGWGYTGGALVLATDNATALLFSVSGSEALGIAADGNVGIGTGTPGNYNNMGNDLVIRRTGNAGVAIIGEGAGGNNSTILFGDDESDVVGGIVYSHNYDRMELKTNGFVTRMTIGSGGDVSASGNMLATAFLYTSDERRKESIKPLAGTLDRLMLVKGVSYRLKDISDTRVRLGVIAQDVEKVFPEAVYSGVDGMKSVDYPALVAPLIESVKALKAANDNLAGQLKAANAEDRAAIEDLRRELKALKRTVNVTGGQVR